MSVGDWGAVVESMVRCLTAIEPEIGDRAFGRMLDVVCGGPSNPSAINPAGEWFRSADGDRPGYIYIGPSGQDHHFQASAPDGVDLTTMRPMPPSPVGRLWAEIDAAMQSAKMLVSREKTTIEGQGGRLIAVCDEADLPTAAALLKILEVASLYHEPDADSVLMRRSAGAFLAALGQPAEAQLAAATGEIMRLRSNYLANAPAWGVSVVRSEALKRFLDTQAKAAGLDAKLFDASGFLSSPEEAFRQCVSDLARAQHGDIVMAICDLALGQAEDAVQSALDAEDVTTHQATLYAAAGWSYAGMRIAEIMRGDVAPSLWPADLTEQLLGGYATKTEEIVVRCQEALAVACINAASGQAARRHRAQVAAEGSAKADELIEDYWYYPRAARPMLLPSRGGPNEQQA